jgi:hypothetical protein
MSYQTQVRSSTSVTFKDTVNNNAEFDANWDVAEGVIIAVSDLNPAISNGIFKIESIDLFGTGTTPSAANAERAQIIVARDAAFTDVLLSMQGFMSDGKYDTTKCAANWRPGVFVQVEPTDSLYITVKCPSSAALTVTSARITISQ